MLDCIWTLTRLDVIVKSIPQRGRKFVCVTSRSCEKYGIIREYEDETARRAVIHRVESENERFDCISDMHKFGVKVQQFLWTETSAETTAL